MKLNPFTAIIAASALVMASVTAIPAEAGNSERNLLGLMLGLGTLAIIADNAHDKKKEAAEVTHRESGVRLYGYDWNERTYRRDRPNRRERIRHRMYHGHEAPKTCLRKRWTPDGWKTYRSKPCMKRYKARHHFHGKKQTNHFHTRDGRIVTMRDLRGWNHR